MSQSAHGNSSDRDVQKSLASLSWLYFFLADIQTGVGPFLAAYLAASHWNARSIGVALTAGGLIGVAIAPFAGALVDASQNKRRLVATATLALSAGAALIALGTRHAVIGIALLLLGTAGAFLGPALAAITLGIAGPRRFDRQFGRNQSFNAAGNVITALLLAAVSWVIGLRSIFVVASVLAIPVWLVLHRIRPETIDNDLASGNGQTSTKRAALGQILHLCADRTLLIFFACAFLFHFANAAMLPQLGEMLAKGDTRAAAPFMAACIIVTQCVIAVSASSVGRLAASIGRKPLLLVGFGVLPIRGLLYAVVHAKTALIAVQVLDGVANSIFGVVAILVIADRMRGKGHFNLAQGALATCIGLGASFSTAFGGILAHRFGFRVSFVGLAGVALLALILLWTCVPETLQPPAADAL